MKRLPHRGNADLYADPKARADDLVGQGVTAEFTGYVVDVIKASRATLGAAWDTFAPAIGGAITDIRKKFEEFAWGREVTAREVDISRDPPSVETRMGFRELMRAQELMLPHTPDRAAQAREHSGSGPEM